MKGSSALIKSFCRARSGNIATIFAFSLIPVMGALGAALDYSLAHTSRSKLQLAVDAAALAVTKAAAKDPALSKSELRRIARKVFEANSKNLYLTTAADLKTAPIEEGYKVNATAQVKTQLIHLLGIRSIDVGVTGVATASMKKYEISMVLDNSGSMFGTKISALRAAAQKLADTVLKDSNKQDNVKVALVPFAGAVNVGPSNATATWMDLKALSSIHKENLGFNANRFQAYSNIDGANWSGCVEVRPAPHDVTDKAPTPGDYDTYFVPTFAPDEPDYDWRYLNSYVSDGATSWCSALPSKWQWLCKYYKKKANVQYKYGTITGPNFLCDSKPLTPLTTDRLTITNAIKAMEARGATNIHQAVMWGWRTLSPGEPFTEGSPYTDTDVTKVMVVMSDGMNTYMGLNNPKLSSYSAYGYAINGRLGIKTSNSSALTGAMNAKTLLACKNAKDAGIQIYTVAFDLNDKKTLQMLKNCASSKSMALTANNSSDLIATFEEIGSNISKIRLTR